MRCETYTDPELGATVIVCSRGRRTAERPCSAGCGRQAIRLCDGLKEPLAFGQPKPATCDAWICDVCRVQAPDGRDLCPGCVQLTSGAPDYRQEVYTYSR